MTMDRLTTYIRQVHFKYAMVVKCIVKQRENTNDLSIYLIGNNFTFYEFICISLFVDCFYGVWQLGSSACYAFNQPFIVIFIR